MKLKYIIVNDSLPVLFGLYFQHISIRTNGTVTSAGFCSIAEVDTEPNGIGYSEKVFKAEVWGESVSLKVKSEPRDAKVIENMLNSHEF